LRKKKSLSGHSMIANDLVMLQCVIASGTVWVRVC
jgi:hypothetical protein